MNAKNVKIVKSASIVMINPIVKNVIIIMVHWKVSVTYVPLTTHVQNVKKMITNLNVQVVSTTKFSTRKNSAWIKRKILVNNKAQKVQRHVP